MPIHKHTFADSNIHQKADISLVAAFLVEDEKIKNEKNQRKEHSPMANEVVKYHNDLNKVSMRTWTAEEMNFFFAILCKLKDNGTTSIVLGKDQLSELARYAGEHNMRLYDVLERLGRHVLEMKYIEKTSHSIDIMALFQRFKVDCNKDFSKINVTVRVSEEFEYILNRLNANFTKFELEEFVKLKSTYSKQMYRLLKQWKTIGEKVYSTEELRYLLNVPKSYKTSHIADRVLKPIQKELNPYFRNLNISSIKKHAKGNPVIGYQFTWTPEKTNEWVEGKSQLNPNRIGKIEDYPAWYTQIEHTEASEELKKEVHKLQKQLEEDEI